MTKKEQKNNILTVVVCLLLIVCASIAIFLSKYDWHLDSVLGGFAPLGPSASPSGALSEVKEPVDWDYFDDTVMVGDSITYGMASYNYLSFNNVFAKIGLHQGTALTSKCVYTSKTTSYSIADALSRALPGKVYITLGINAIYSAKNDSFYDNYQALLNKIKKATPDSVIIIQSIFPVTQKWANDNGKPNCHEYIAYANSRLAQLAEENECYYLHTYEALCDDDGFLRSKFSGDGIHLSGKGYEEVFNYILTHPVESSGEFTKIGAIKPPVVYSSNSSTVSMPDISTNNNISSANPTINGSSISKDETSSNISSKDSSDSEDESSDTSDTSSGDKTSSKESDENDENTSSVSSKKPLSSDKEDSPNNNTSSKVSSTTQNENSSKISENQSRQKKK